jgi:hypothetical protein
MFNRGAFNRTGFNQLYTIYVYASATLEGAGELTAFGQMEFNPILSFDGYGELTAAAICDIFFSAVFDGVGEIVANPTIDRYGNAVLDGLGELIANGSRFHVDFIQIDGTFAPGDKIVIDAKKMTITQNGVNILSQMSGDFFELNNGTNSILYTDTASGRSILLRFTHRDKYLY